MSTIRVSENERYPDYSIREGDGLEVEATPEQIERWTSAAEAYEAAQREMGELHRAAAALERERADRAREERLAAERAERERLSEERRVRLEDQRARQEVMRTQLRASGGVVYDAAGNPIGSVTETSNGMRLHP